jgi:hypothetical protein
VLSADKLVEAAHDLRFTLEQILQEDLRCFGFVSFASCFETIVHLQRDIDRLYALHQKLVDPAKHVAYAAFWIRKIKPVSNAFPLLSIAEAKKNGGVVDEGLELTNVNEQIALFYIWRLIEAYLSDGQIAPPHGLSKSQYIKNIATVFERFIADEAERPILNVRFDTILYDMRYRTFGPHHLVHIAHYLLREAAADGAS